MRISFYLLALAFVALGSTAFAQPANDASANDTVVSHATNWCSADAAYTTINATNDGTKPTTWGGGPYNNVWFKFQATTTEVAVSVRTGGSEDTLRHPQRARQTNLYTMSMTTMGDSV